MALPTILSCTLHPIMVGIWKILIHELGRKEAGTASIKVNNVSSCFFADIKLQTLKIL